MTRPKASEQPAEGDRGVIECELARSSGTADDKKKPKEQRSPERSDERGQ